MSYIAWVTNKSGHKVDFDAAVEYMDEDLREKIHSKLSPCTEQEFFTAYEKAHADLFGCDWFLSECNPTW